MGDANYSSFRFHRGLDDAHKAGAEFDARRSMPVGQAASVLLLLLLPFRDFISSLAIEFGGPGPEPTGDQRVVVFAMTLICLLSALRFHGIGTQLPAEVWIAVQRSTSVPRSADGRLAQQTPQSR